MSRMHVYIHAKFLCSCLQKCTILKSTCDELQNARMHASHTCAQSLNRAVPYNNLSHTDTRFKDRSTAYDISSTQGTHIYNNTSHTHTSHTHTRPETGRQRVIFL